MAKIIVENRCAECKYPLADSKAIYGWRCAKKLGVTVYGVPLTYKQREAVSGGIANADRHIRKNNLKLSKTETEKFYELFTDILASDVNKEYLNILSSYGEILRLTEKNKGSGLTNKLKQDNILQYENDSKESEIKIYITESGRSIKLNGRSQEEADKIIQENAQNIKDAAEKFDVNPCILAATIYAEQRINVNWIDELTDYAGSFFLDTSIGTAQVKVSTAIFLEDAGYMPITPDRMTPPYAKTQEPNRRGRIAAKLCDPKTSIEYAAAYLKYWQDRWKEAYPEISGRTAILATLYNQGETKLPHADPQPNEFGEFAKEYYYHMQKLLELD